VSHNPIYALMLLHNYDCSELIDVVNISKERHTASNMVQIVIDIFTQSALKTLCQLNAW
jgi:hypothetical protein